MANGTKGRSVLATVPYCGLVNNGVTGLRNPENKKQILASAMTCPSTRRGYGFDQFENHLPVYVPAQNEDTRSRGGSSSASSASPSSSGSRTDSNSGGTTAVPDLSRVFSADAHSSVHETKRRVLTALLFPHNTHGSDASSSSSDGQTTSGAYTSRQRAGGMDLAEDEQMLQEARRRAAALWPSLVKNLPSPSSIRATAKQRKATADTLHDAVIHAVGDAVEDFEETVRELRHEYGQQSDTLEQLQRSGLDSESDSDDGDYGTSSGLKSSSKRRLLAAAVTNVRVGGACTAHTQCNQNSTDKYLAQNANKGAFCTGAKTCDSCSACQYDQIDSVDKVCPEAQCPGSGKFPGCVDALKLGKDWACPSRYNFSIYKYFSPSDNIQVAPSSATSMKYITPFNRYGIHIHTHTHTHQGRAFECHEHEVHHSIQQVWHTYTHTHTSLHSTGMTHIHKRIHIHIHVHIHHSIYQA
jgi:hypothetical protein